MVLIISLAQSGTSDHNGITEHITSQHVTAQHIQRLIVNNKAMHFTKLTIFSVYLPAQCCPQLLETWTAVGAHRHLF